MRYKEINVDWTPKELDCFLQKNYGYSLWHFALSLAMNYQGWIDYRDVRDVKMRKSGILLLSWGKFWKKRINELRQLKKKNLVVLQGLLNRKLPQIDKWELPRALLEKKITPQISSSEEKYIEIMFELHPYFKVLNELIKRMENCLERQKLLGASYKRTNIISLIWSHFIKDKVIGKTQVANITGLLEWFYDKFEDIDYFAPLNEEISRINNSKITKLLYRYRHGKEKIQEILNTEVEHGKKIFEESTMGSKIISFKGKKQDKSNIQYKLIKAMRESDWEKDNYYPPLISFPKKSKLTVRDFKENSAKANVSYEKRAYKSFLQ